MKTPAILATAAVLAAAAFFTDLRAQQAAPAAAADGKRPDFPAGRECTVTLDPADLPETDFLSYSQYREITTAKGTLIHLGPEWCVLR